MFERKHSRTEICFLVMHLNPLTELNNLVKIVGVLKNKKQNNSEKVENVPYMKK